METLASPPENRTAQDNALAGDVDVSKSMRLSLAKSPARIESTQEARSHTTFTKLPVEIRAKIFDMVVDIPSPISTHEFEMLCTGANCGIIIDRKRSETKQALMDSCFPVFHTSRRFRLDALDAFVRVNTWDVQTHLLLIPRSWPSPMTHSGLSIESLAGIRNFYMRVDLCSAGFDILSPGSLQLPPELDRSDKLACRRWIRQSQLDDESTPENQTEPAVCCDHLSRLDDFITAIARVEGSPRSLTIDVVIHRGTRLKTPKMDQCGLTLRVEVQFLTSVHADFAPPQLQTTGALILVQQNFCEPMEHRRRFLAPLLRPHNIQRITVKRSWSVKYEVTTVIEGDGAMVGSILMTETVYNTVAMGHLMHYKTALAFLKAVGKDFRNFTLTGLRQMGIRADQVVGYEENTPWTDKTIIVPPAPPGYLGEDEASL